MRLLRLFLSGLTLTVMSVTGLVQAGDLETDRPADQNLQADVHNPAYLRFAHFAAATGAVRVQLNPSITLVEGSTFGQMTPWEALPAGDYAVEVSLVETGLLLFATALTMVPGDRLTVIITRTDETIQGNLLREDYSPTQPDETRLTVFNAIPDSPALDLRLDGRTIIDSVVYPASVEVDATAISVPPASYALDFALNDDGILVINTDQIEMLPNRNYFAAAVNTLEDPRLVLIATDLPARPAGAATGTALVRVAHLSSGTPPLRVVLQPGVAGSSPVDVTLAFPEYGRWQPLPAGEVEVLVTQSPAPDALIPPTIITLTANSYMTIAIIGTPINNTLAAHAIVEDFSPLEPGYVHVNVFNAHPGAGPLDFRHSDGTAYVSGLGYPGYFGGNNGYNQFIVETGSYDLQVVQTETGTILFELPGTSFYPGRSYSIAAINANPPFILTFSDIEETQRMMSDP